jgi:hypothetical protein
MDRINTYKNKFQLLLLVVFLFISVHTLSATPLNAPVSGFYTIEFPGINYRVEGYNTQAISVPIK